MMLSIHNTKLKIHLLVAGMRNTEIIINVLFNTHQNCALFVILYVILTTILQNEANSMGLTLIL